MSAESFRLASAASLLSFVAHAAQAQSDSSLNEFNQLVLLDPVVVSAARTEQKLSEVIPSVTVITREEIERSLAPTLVDLLQGETGVEIARNGGPGTVASFFLRGQNSVNVAIFIDGVRTQVDQIASIKLVDMPLGEIERIEILRGNVGALYGESAIGGVINIYTRDIAGPPAVFGGVTVGSRNTTDVSVGYRGAADGNRFSLSAQKLRTDGFSAMNPNQNAAVNPDKDAYSRESVYLRLDRDIHESLTLGVSANLIASDADFDSGNPTFPGFPGDLPTDTQRLETRSSDITLFGGIKASSQWQSNFSLTQSALEIKDFKNGEQLTDENGGLITGDQSSLRWENNYRLSNATVLFGLDLARSKFDSYGATYDRDVQGYFVGYSHRQGPFDFQANLRYDSVAADSTLQKVTTDATTWLTGIGYFLTDELRLTGTLSTAFRAPATGELYGFGGNPDLKPEEHRASEIGLSFNSGKALMRLVRFDTTTSNAIIYSSSNNSYSNVGRVENTGFEATFSASLQGGVAIKISAVSQDPRDAATGARLSRRAKNYGSVDVSTPVLGYELGVKSLWSGDRLDGSNTLGSYVVTNLYASRSLNSEWKARLKVENAFNEDYQLAYGYNTPPRGVFLSLQYQPKN